MLFRTLILLSLTVTRFCFADERRLEVDLLVVGGTESGCAAAVQAARMGVPRVALVNDIDWLGGQFSAEALGAIDENRAHGYDGTVPIPRSGLFRDVIDAIERRNRELYGGVSRPGNTRVITTCRPVEAERVFRNLLAPFEEDERIQRFSHYRVESVLKSGDRVVGARFVANDQQPSLTIEARMTIDASDWGDVIQLAGAAWDAGVDSKDEYHEPSAPEQVDVPNDMNPITWCMIVEEQPVEALIPRPAGYDERCFTGTWSWIKEEFAYTTRRLVDGHGFGLKHPDVLLINNPNIDYPVDRYPKHVADQLEARQAGDSRKSIVALRPDQREIVLNDAKQHSLNYFHYLQQQFPRFRKLALSSEFGTADRLPPKPYVRESLRLRAKHVVKEQEVVGMDSRSNYATTMFPDAVFSWQFELDFHPTQREFLTDREAAGPWEATFRGNRRFGRGGTGRAVFPLRALVPEKVVGLLAAQKNLGYTSIVGSSCRLHDQSIHAGQASGAVAAVCLRHREEPGDYFLRPERLAEIWNGLLDTTAGTPLVIWPFGDVEPEHPAFAAIQQLALRRLLNLTQLDTAFLPDEPATTQWLAALIETGRATGYSIRSEEMPSPPATRGAVAIALWREIEQQPMPFVRLKPDDADDDGVPDTSDPLPFTAEEFSWRKLPALDGMPDDSVLAIIQQQVAGTVSIDFCAQDSPASDGFKADVGRPFDPERGYGWTNDLTANTRLRKVASSSLVDSFVFTRAFDQWSCRVEPGTYEVHVCIGDSGHEQAGQHVSVQGKSLAEHVDTPAGGFRELKAIVEVPDGLLNVQIGHRDGGSNTCLNWLVAAPVKQ
ncbi:MAG: FAD-dependent oxidoreductase [Pirellulaceae bacterium]